MINFFNEIIVRNNFWHIFLIIIFWGGFVSFFIWWINALTHFIESKMKKRYGTIWWPVVAWKSSCRFFAKPKKWKKKQIVVIILFISIFFLQHFGNRTEVGKSFYKRCEQVKRVLTLQIYQTARTSKKKVWWEIPIELLLNTARIAGTVKQSTDAINIIKGTKESEGDAFN